MSFNAYKYATVFEKLACRIIEHEISEDILISGVTKKTRDGGIDAIIYTEDSFITIEAKLRKNTVSLGLKDIASSVIFYMLRLNDRHYIVTNVYFSSETIDILNKLNKTNDCELFYIDGDSTIKILKELKSSLNDEEKELAEILLKEFSESQKFNQNKKENTYQKNQYKLLKKQDEICNLIARTLYEEKKCVVLSGKLGTGKTTIAKEIKEKINDSHNAIFIDCQQYNTIESFMYQISNVLIGIDINELINEYISLSNNFEDAKIINIKNKETLNILTQVLSRDPYNYSIKFLAQKYIDKIIDDFNIKKVCIIADNYSAASPELDEFITTYILNSTDKLKFLIIKDIDFDFVECSYLDKVISLPANIKAFKEFEIHEADYAETNEYIDFLSPNLSSVCKKSLYSYFGGNLELIKMAINDMNLKNNYNVSLLRPIGYEDLYKKRLFHFLGIDIFYIKAFFACWIMNSTVTYSVLALIEDTECINKLLNTYLFDENNASLKLNNICTYNIISKYFTKFGFQIYYRISDYINQIKKLELGQMAKVRIAFIEQSENFVSLSQQAIKSFENKLEHENIVETYVLLYIYTHNCINNKIEQIETTANVIYETIDSSTYKFRFDLNFIELENELQLFFEKLDTLDEFENLNQSEKHSVSIARIKYALYLYFTNKRKNDFKGAYDSLNIPQEYLLNCTNEILISKIIRFKAICQKEMGDRDSFFKILYAATKDYPNNKYLLSVYNANLAAYKNLEISPTKAFEIIDDIALPSAETVDQYLHLWLMNDRLIYGIQAKKYNNDQVKKIYASIMCKADYLCSATDKARAYNTYGAFCLQANKDRKTARMSFKNALFIISKYESNSIMIYFAINYLQLLYPEEKQEFNIVSELIFNWCVNNNEYITNKLKDPFILPGNNKLIVALYSFMDMLKKRNDIKYDMLMKIRCISDLIENRISINQLFYINGEPIILF